MEFWARVRLADDIVTEVIVADQAFVTNLVSEEPAEWIKCDYYTQHNTHQQGGTPLRGNYPSVGFIYNRDHDIFIEPQPYPSWLLNTAEWKWEAPVPYPTDALFYYWDEYTQRWLEHPWPIGPAGPADEDT